MLDTLQDETLLRYCDQRGPESAEVRQRGTGERTMAMSNWAKDRKDLWWEAISNIKSKQTSKYHSVLVCFVL